MVPDERREQILSCARTAFGERSYAEVSLGEIASEAGVARGLINHYFGDKRKLYLEAIATMVMVPEVTLEILPKGSLAERVDGIVDHFLSVIHRHRGIWLTTVSLMSGPKDDDVAEVTFEAEERTVDVLIAALGVDPALGTRDEIRAMIRAYGSLARSASFEWLGRGALSRTQVHELLAVTMHGLAQLIQGSSSHRGA